MTETAALEAAPAPSINTIDHLSHSSLKTFALCPRKWAYRNLENAEEEFKPSALAFGSAFHCAVERVQECRLQGIAIPELDALLSVYDDAWNRETQGRVVQFCKDEDVASLHDLARKMLDAYSAFAALEAALPETGQIISIEHANRFRLLADAPPIESRIDLLELQGTDLVVSDLKTSRSKYSDAKVQEAIPQLVLYATGLLPLMRELGATRIVTKFVVVTKAKKPVVQVIQPQCSQNDVTHVRQMILEQWQSIKTGVYPRRESWACNSCPYRRQCLGR
jgi:CRISPR/Cas system-associated exonuclease Cas4 (RecB family)